MFGLRRQEDEIVQLVLAAKKKGKYAGPLVILIAFMGIGVHFLAGSQAAPAAPGRVNDSALTYSGVWQDSQASDAYGGDEHISLAPGAQATLRFTGTGVRYYGTKAPGQGIAAVSIDGGPEVMVDLYSSTQINQALLYASPPLAAGRHELRIRAAGSKNDRSGSTAITVDAVDVIDASSGR